MNKTGIEWADYTWNPVTGCMPVSEGCQNCYAARIAKRFWKGRKFSDIQFHPERLAEIKKFPAGALVFVGSMTDMFHPGNLGPNWDIGKIGSAMRERSDLNFVILTKRPENIPPRCYMDNLMIGVSVENSAHLDRIETLRRNYAGPKCVSFEPLLESIDFMTGFIEGIDWIIAGQETGPHAREACTPWFEEIQEFCEYLKIPYFEKKVPYYEPIREWPANFRARKAGGQV